MSLRMVQMPDGGYAYMDDFGRICNANGVPLTTSVPAYPGMQNMGGWTNMPQQNMMAGGMHNANVMNAASGMLSMNTPQQPQPDMYGTSAPKSHRTRRSEMQLAQANQMATQEPLIKKPEAPKVVPQPPKPKKKSIDEVLDSRYLLAPGTVMLEEIDKAVDFTPSGIKFNVIETDKTVNKSLNKMELYINTLKALGIDPDPDTIYTLEWQMSNQPAKIVYNKKFIRSPYVNPHYANMDLDKCMPGAVHTINLLGADLCVLVGERFTIDDASDIIDAEDHIKNNGLKLSSRAFDYSVKVMNNIIKMYGDITAKAPTDITESKQVAEINPDISSKTIVFNNRVLEQFVKLYKTMEDGDYCFKLVKYSFPELYKIVANKIKATNELFLDFVIMGDDSNSNPTCLTVRVINPLKYMEYTEMENESDTKIRMSTFVATFINNLTLK